MRNTCLHCKFGLLPHHKESLDFFAALNRLMKVRILALKIAKLKGRHYKKSGCKYVIQRNWKMYPSENLQDQLEWKGLTAVVACVSGKINIQKKVTCQIIKKNIYILKYIKMTSIGFENIFILLLLFSSLSQISNSN